MGGTPANRTLTPRAPEKGVFPLDHFGECKEAMAEYMACLKEAAFATERCRHLSKRYLECRMSRGLMAEEDLRKLGFKEKAAEAEAPQAAAQPATREAERGGFVAGLRPAVAAQELAAAAAAARRT